MNPKPLVEAVVSALTAIADEIAELRRSVDHHAVVTARPELHAQAAGYYADNHGLVHKPHA